MPTPDSFRRKYNPLYHYLLFSIILAAFAFKLEWQLPILAIIVITTVLSRHRKIIYRGFLKFVLPLILIGFLINGIFFVGRPVFSIGPISFKDAGILFASRVAVRLILIVVSVSWYFSTVKTETISQYLIARGADRRLVYIFLLSIAMVHLMRDKLQRVYIAQSARGLDATKNLASRLRYLLPMLVPLSYSYITESLDRGIALRAAHFAEYKAARLSSKHTKSLLVIEETKSGMVIGRSIFIIVVLIGLLRLTKWL